MKGTRWLLLLAIVAVLGGSGYTYLVEKRYAQEHQTAKPAALPSDTNATALDYEWAQSSGGFASVQVKAKTFRQVRDTPEYELGGLELRLNQKDRKHYDLIKSSRAKFNKAEGHMYSEGDVEITLDIPIDGQPLHQLTSIKTSGVLFDSKTGKATTDRPAQFTFENGSGKSLGASYDPTAHELHLLHDPEMNLRGKAPGSKAMKIEGGEIVYKETGSLVYLTPWSRMTRAETTINAGVSVINLKHGHIDNIDAQQARGVDRFPTRELRYSADTLHVTYGADGKIAKMSGNGRATIRQESQGAVTDMHSNTADMDFVSPGGGESILQHVLANGNAVATSEPAPAKDGRRAENRILKSNTIEINMRPDGREIDQVRTHAPGTLEFLPNAPDQHRRMVTGERMTIGYAPRNLLKDYRVVNVTTVTFPAANTKLKNAAPSKTASQDLSASFDQRGQLASIKQWNHFTYEEGDRRAKAETALLEQVANTIDLESGSRIWDSSGSTDANTIHLIQKTGDYTADGHVMTSRMPEQESKPDSKNTKQGVRSGEMLDGAQPIQGTAHHMTSTKHNKLIRYEGEAVVWQGSDRIEAQAIEIDRERHSMTATGGVTTQFLDQGSAKSSDQSSAKAKNGDPLQGAKITKVAAGTAPVSLPIYTVVTSSKMVYTDTDRLAHYTGDVVLNRPGLKVKGNELLAFLNPKDTTEDSRLKQAIADGKVEIVETGANRHRVARGDHGEYVVSEDKVILRGDLADLYDSTKKDESHGSELTYFTSDDRLLIKGAPSKPVDSHLHRKPRANAHSGNR